MLLTNILTLCEKVYFFVCQFCNMSLRYRNSWHESAVIISDQKNNENIIYHIFPRIFPSLINLKRISVKNISIHSYRIICTTVMSNEGDDPPMKCINVVEILTVSISSYLILILILIRVMNINNLKILQ